jgi:hypothetical protein
MKQREHENAAAGRRPLRLAAAALGALVAVAWALAARAQEPSAPYTIQAIAERLPVEAERAAMLLRQVLGEEHEIRVEFRGSYHGVRVGRYSTVAEARRVLAQLRDLGYTDAWIDVMPPPAAAGPELEGRATRTDSDRRTERAVEVPAVAVAPQAARPPSPALIDPPAPPVVAPGADRSAPPQPPPAQALAYRDQRGAPSGKRIEATRILDEPPAVDGVLDDPAWGSAVFVSDFQQKGAKRGFPPRDRTEVAFLYDDDALYVAGRIHAEDASLVRAAKSRRDDPANADRLIVSLDTYRNRETAYNFGVTAGGTRLDYYQPQDEFEVRDFSFDPVWDARTSVGAGGWTAEMRIPFSSLQFRGGDRQVWGVNVQRVSPAQRLYAFWVVVPGEETGWSSRFGELIGLEGVQPPRRFAVVPYVAGQRVRSDFSTDGPFARDGDVEERFGGDVMVGLGPSLTLEATFNPDFGQIEADPAVVNLTDYEVFFPEKRPFFLEGAQLLQGPGPRYYYSRRIGAPPRTDLGARSRNDAFREVPTTTTILGAAKIIGRLQGGWSVGSLFALGDDEQARFFDPETETIGELQVSPRTFFGVGRLQKDFGAGSTFGFVGTGVGRDLGETDALSTVLPRQAFAGGIDWNLRFAGQSHEFGGFAGGSVVEGEPGALLQLQRASAHYYQRPDADHVELDPLRTSLSGYTAGLRLARIAGPLRWTLAGEARSPGFEINDAGALASADDLVGFAQIGYGTPMKRGALHRVDVSASLANGWNFGEVRQFTTPALDVSLVWRNFWRTYLRVAHDTRALSDSLTRGGPLMGTGEAWRSRAGVSSNDARRHVWSLDGLYGSDELGGRTWGASTRLLLRPKNRFTFSITPGYERTRDVRQFFTSLEGGAPEAFGRRYVFATLDQSTTYARLRAGLSLTPNLGLDLYVEPFAANGTFDRFGELAAARSRELRLYGTDGTTITRLDDGSWVVTDGEQSFPLDDADFDSTSFRSNVVFHWDYARGSTLFVVWTQNRLGEDFTGEPVGPRDLLETFDAPGEDVIAVKASFRSGPR